MKIEIPLFTKPGNRFTSVARIIVNGEAPDWLLIGLEQFAGFVGTERRTVEDDKDLHRILDQMRDAADVLIKYIPILAFTPAGEGVASDVELALPLLAKIRATIPGRTKRAGGPPP